MYLSELMQEAVQMKRENVILTSTSPHFVKSDKQENTL